VSTVIERPPAGSTGRTVDTESTVSTVITSEAGPSTSSAE
jgi:hypothetical protein